MLSAKHGGDVTPQDEIFEAVFSGIMAAFNATAYDTDGDDFSRCRTLAHTALANLEASGFKVVPNA